MFRRNVGLKADYTPGRHNYSNRDQEADPAGAVGGILDPFGDGSLAVLPPGKAISDQQRQAETDDQFGEEVVYSQEFSHG